MRLHGFTTLPPQTEKKICRIFKEIKKIEQTDVTALLKKTRQTIEQVVVVVLLRDTHTKKGQLKPPGGL